MSIQFTINALANIYDLFPYHHWPDSIGSKILWQTQSHSTIPHDTYNNLFSPGSQNLPGTEINSLIFHAGWLQNKSWSERSVCTGTAQHVRLVSQAAMFTGQTSFLFMMISWRTPYQHFLSSVANVIREFIIKLSILFFEILPQRCHQVSKYTCQAPVGAKKLHSCLLKARCIHGIACYVTRLTLIMYTHISHISLLPNNFFFFGSNME